MFVGPACIHYRKTFSTYLFFATTIIGQCRELEGICAVGTDGEQALVDAFMHEFGFAQQLTFHSCSEECEGETCGFTTYPLSIAWKCWMTFLVKGWEQCTWKDWWTVVMLLILTTSYRRVQVEEL